MKVPSRWLRWIHKWIGILVGLQFVLWAVSGTAMALLDMEEVAGGRAAEPPAVALQSASPAWPLIGDAIGRKVTALRTRPLLDRQLLEIEGPGGTALVDPQTGRPVVIGAALAAAIASAAHPENLPTRRVQKMRKITLAIRGEALPIWKADFADSAKRSYYISGTTGEVLARRNESWRWWDIAWMLHTMDYSQRTSFNHPLIVFAAIAMAWVAVTGFWLLFRTMWRHDAAWLRSRLTR